ncbi:hypothetical protein E2I00_017050, partial [Balaenoptera physalus]
NHDTFEAFLSEILAGVGGRGVLDTIGTSVSQARAAPSPARFSQTALGQLCGLHQAPGTPQEEAALREKTELLTTGHCVSLQKRHFVDHRRVLVRGGRGGDGVSCFHSEPRKEFGGPDGGDGGYGGHQVKSLSSVLSQYQGFDGGAGGRKNCFGRSGAVLYIQVPVGTLVKEGNEVLADLSHPGDEFIAALGGAGGKGNRFFLANDNRAPTTCTPGQPGQERVLFLELKTVAHAGLVGRIPQRREILASVGRQGLSEGQGDDGIQSDAYRRKLFPEDNVPIKNSKPAGDERIRAQRSQVPLLDRLLFSSAVADIPGIICGAHQNRGLGLAFLRHIERCPFLLFVLDLSVPEPWTQLDDLKYELEQYRQGLSERPHAVVANKELHDDHVAAELERGRQPLRW